MAGASEDTGHDDLNQVRGIWVDEQRVERASVEPGLEDVDVNDVNLDGDERTAVAVFVDVERARKRIAYVVERRPDGV